MWYLLLVCRYKHPQLTWFFISKVFPLVALDPGLFFYLNLTDLSCSHFSEEACSCPVEEITADVSITIDSEEVAICSSTSWDSINTGGKRRSYSADTLQVSWPTYQSLLNYEVDFFSADYLEPHYMSDQERSVADCQTASSKPTREYISICVRLGLLALENDRETAVQVLSLFKTIMIGNNLIS